MLIRLDNPRLVINAQEFPQHVVLMALRYDEAPGEVNVTYFDTGSASGQRSQRIEPTRSLDIANGMSVHEFVLPFTELHDRLGRRGATQGFQFTANSAFRHQSSYGVRTLEFTMQFPVIGGGIIRFSIGGQEWELANPTFYPLAEAPPINRSYGSEGQGDEYISGPPGIENKRVPDDVLVNAYRRTHAGYTRPGRAEDIERRRQQRVANFDLREGVVEEEPQAPRQYSGPGTTREITHEDIQQVTLEGGTYREPPQAIPVPPGVVVDPVEQRRQARLAQIRQAEEARQAEQPLIQAQPPSILVSPPRAPKKPPRTRFERTEDD
jgi:hypothetical protein